ncbi:DUF4405 domain-containing protein [Candidatus Pacearchaeota archaeon]|nr:DUF4405 domain-containing protein [Candidatus Pacearchaeota archaeon]
MNKLKLKFLVDVLMFFSFLTTAVSGFVLWLVLPRGSGRAGNVFIFFRETWLLIHDWFSVLLVILILFHLVLNWGWIKSVFKISFGKRN